MLEELLRPREIIKNRLPGTAVEGSGEIEYGTLEELLPGIVRSLYTLPGVLHRLEKAVRRFENLEASSPSTDSEPSYTVRQVAELLQVSTTKVYLMTEKGELRSYKVGNQVRIKASDIRDFQNRHTKAAGAGVKKKPRSYNKSEADRIFGEGWAD